MRRRFLAVTTATVMAISLAACGKADNNTEATVITTEEGTTTDSAEASSTATADNEPTDASGLTQSEVLDILAGCEDYSYDEAYSTLVYDYSVSSEFAADCMTYYISNINQDAFPEEEFDERMNGDYLTVSDIKKVLEMILEDEPECSYDKAYLALRIMGSSSDFATYCIANYIDNVNPSAFPGMPDDVNVLTKQEILDKREKHQAAYDAAVEERNRQLKQNDDGKNNNSASGTADAKPNYDVTYVEVNISDENAYYYYLLDQYTVDMTPDDLWNQNEYNISSLYSELTSRANSKEFGTNCEVREYDQDTNTETTYIYLNEQYIPRSVIMNDIIERTGIDAKEVDTLMQMRETRDLITEEGTVKHFITNEEIERYGDDIIMTEDTSIADIVLEHAFYNKYLRRLFNY